MAPHPPECPAQNQIPPGLSSWRGRARPGRPRGWPCGKPRPGHGETGWAELDRALWPRLLARLPPVSAPKSRSELPNFPPPPSQTNRPRRGFMVMGVSYMVLFRIILVLRYSSPTSLKRITILRAERHLLGALLKAGCECEWHVTCKHVNCST